MVGAAGNQIATGIGPGKTHGRGGRGRAVLTELDHLGALDQREELLRTCQFDRRRTGEITASVEFSFYCFDDWGIGMPQADGPASHPVVDVFAPLSIPNPTPRAARDKRRCQDRVLIVPLGVGVAPSRNEVMSEVFQARGNPQPVKRKLMTVRTHATLRACRYRASGVS